MVTPRYNALMKVDVLEELIEHKVAPYPLVAIQGLVNTHDHEDETELLGDPEAAREWLTGAGLIEEGAAVSDQDFRELIDFREVLRKLLESNLTGRPAPEAARELGELSKLHAVKFGVNDEGEVGLDLDPAEDVDDMICQFVGIIGQAQDQDWWRRLKICAADDCRWAFYDASKNRGGTWCRMEVCGNRNKNRRFRSKPED